MVNATTIKRDPGVNHDGAAPTQSKRLVSLDAFRGWNMFWIIAGLSIMAGLKELGNNPVLAFFTNQMDHTPWQGLRCYDLIWPSFMMMTGMTLPFSYAKRSLTETHSRILHRVLKRVVVLFLLGSLRESIFLDHPYLIELSSALQPIAYAYLVAFLMIRKSWRFQAVFAILVLFVYALVLAFIPSPGVAAGTYSIGRNLVYAVDMAVLGRAYDSGWGTVLCEIPTVSTTILGLLIGRLLKSDRSQNSKLGIIALTGSICLALGYALNPVIPIIMKLWTTSYALVTAGWACLIFLFFYWTIDVLGFRKWAFPFVVIGMNSLAIYVGRSIVPFDKIVGIFTSPIALKLGVWGVLFEVIAVVIVEWYVLYWMYKRKIYLIA